VAARRELPASWSSVRHGPCCISPAHDVTAEAGSLCVTVTGAVGYLCWEMGLRYPLVSRCRTATVTKYTCSYQGAGPTPACTCCCMSHTALVLAHSPAAMDNICVYDGAWAAQLCLAVIGAGRVPAANSTFGTVSVNSWDLRHATCRCHHSGARRTSQRCYAGSST
jgi:hypothetical protein